MMTSKSAGPADGDRSWANIGNTTVRNAPSQKKFRFIASIEEVANSDVDAKTSARINRIFRLRERRSQRRPGTSRTSKVVDPGACSVHFPQRTSRVALIAALRTAHATILARG